VIKYLTHTVSDSMPVADEVHENGFFIGNHHYDVFDALKKIMNLLNTVV